MNTEHPTTPPPVRDPSPGRKSWFTRFVLDPLSSVKLGITLLIVLFVYCSIGSAGIWYPVSLNIFHSGVWHQQMPRQWRMFEMTEYEWFHAPFFIGLIALIALNIIVTTLRRIPFKVVNYGVWMIHTGVLVLMFGSVIYFGSKVEGDTPVFRRLIRINSTAGAQLTLPALPGRSGRIITPDGPYTFTVAQIDPNWPILSGDHEGERTYSVTLKVDAPNRTFMRQLLDGYPQYTEDVIPGRGRAFKLPDFGKKITDDSFTATLDYFPQTEFWTRESSAIAVRTVDSDGERGPWMEIPIHNLPRYNDYVPMTDAVWSAPATLRAHPIDIPVVAKDADNPLTNKFIHVTGYLRYATLETHALPGDQINPILSLSMHTPMAGDVEQTLAAFDPSGQASALGGMVSFKYAQDAAGVQKLIDGATSRLTFDVPAPDGTARPAHLELDLNAGDFDHAVFHAIGDSGWKVRVTDIVHDLSIDQQHTVSLAIVDVQGPGGTTFTRWVFDHPSLTRDLPSDASGANHANATPREPDPRLHATYDPGFSTPLVIVAGPQSQPLRALTLQPDGTYASRQVAPGDNFALGSAGVTINSYTERAMRVQRPVIVPLEQRDRDADRSRWFSLIQVQIETPQGMKRIWLPYHQFALEDQSLAAPGLGRYNPTTVMLSDGSIVDIIFTRESRPLPNPVALADFHLTTHVGGYTGEVKSIRDWTSRLRFWNDKDQRWSQPLSVSSNQPAEYSGFRYFQAFWDKPPQQMVGAQAEAGGLNFTGLGVGNRRGVAIQLAGTIIAVLGMIYAFYVKPVIKRRRRTKVLRELETLGVARKRAAVTANGEASHAREDAAHSLAVRRAVGAAGNGGLGGLDGGGTASSVEETDQ